MGYDLLIVGAGITGATVAAWWAKNRPKERVLVVDTREHLGGNCYDYPANGTNIHRYGPHIFHCRDRQIVNFLSGYTSWLGYQHSVTAQIDYRGKKRSVSFPYSLDTESDLGVSFTDEQIIDHFFRGYSQKMWGCDWDELPASIRNRVPKRLERSNYFPDEFVAMPSLGYTKMFERMFSRADVVLGANPDYWLMALENIPRMVYTGRVDLMPGVAKDSERLRHRTLDLEMRHDLKWKAGTPVMNYCHQDVRFTRATCFRLMTGGRSSLTMLERPEEADVDDLAPFYPIAWERDRYKLLLEKAKALYPSAHFLGRLASYQYLDMHQAVGQALVYCRKTFSD